MPDSLFSSSAGAAPATRLMVILFTDLVDSSALKVRLGDQDYVQHIARPHNGIFRELLRQYPGAMERGYTGDGFMATFASVADAVTCALQFHEALRRQRWERVTPKTRVGVHIGDTIEFGGSDSHETSLASHAADMTARVMSLAEGGQILMTRAAFDSARQSVRALPADGGAAGELEWLAHGQYRFKGRDEPMEVFEVGVKGVSSLRPPADSEKAKRVVTDEQALTLGWRPAVDLPIPSRPGWGVIQKLGEGGFGEVWLGRQERTKEVRAFKFCFDPDRLRAFKRELTFFKLIRKELGDREDIARLLEVQVDQPPFYLESEYVSGGNLKDWAARRGGIDQVPLEVRLEFLASIAHAVASAHTLGIIHKDLKPSNVLIAESADGRPHPRIADFGIGVLTDPTLLERQGLTGTGFTESIMVGNDSSRTGTRLYSPPEALTGGPPTTGWDIYALGVMLYQLVIGDLHKPLGVGWERDVEDELLRADIANAVDVHPQRRFSSASELAERVENLEARRGAANAEKETRTRLAAAEARAVRRKRVLTAAVTVTTLALVGSLVSFIFYRRAVNSASAERAARMQAENNFQLAKASLDALLVELSEGELSKRPEMDQVRLDLLRGVMRHYQRLAEQKATDSSVLLGYARGLTRLGAAERVAGTKEAANAAFTNALAFHAKLPPAEAAATEARLARLETTMEFLRRADPFPKELTQKTIAELDELIVPAKEPAANNPSATVLPAADQAAYLKARCLNILGFHETEESALTDYTRAADLMEALADRWPSNSLLAEWTASIEANLGDTLRMGGEYTRPMALVEKLRDGGGGVSKYLWRNFSPDSRERLVATNATASQLRSVLSAEIDRALRDKSLFDPERFAGVKLSTNTLKLIQTRTPNENPAKLNMTLLREAFPNDLGGVMRGIEELERAIQRFEALWAKDPEAAERTRAFSYAYRNLGFARQQANDETVAFDAFDAATRVATEFADRHPTVMEFRGNQAYELLNASFRRAGDNPAYFQTSDPSRFATSLNHRRKEAEVRDLLAKAKPTNVVTLASALEAHLYIVRWSSDYLGIERERHWREAARLDQELARLGDAAADVGNVMEWFLREQASAHARAKDFAGLAETVQRACAVYARCLTLGKLDVATACEFSLTQILRRARALPKDEAMERQLSQHAQDWPVKKAPAQMLWQLQLLRARLLQNRGKAEAARSLLADIRAQAGQHCVEQPQDIGAAAILADALVAMADGASARTNLDAEIEARSELARTLARLSRQEAPASLDLTVLGEFCQTNRLTPFHLVCGNKTIPLDWEFFVQQGTQVDTNLHDAKIETAGAVRQAVLARSLLDPQIEMAARDRGVSLRPNAQKVVDWLTDTNHPASLGSAAALYGVTEDPDRDAELLDVVNRAAQVRLRLEAEPGTAALLQQLPDSYLDVGRALVGKSLPDASRAAGQALNGMADAMQNGAADIEQVGGWIQKAQSLLETIKATNSMSPTVLGNQYVVVCLRGKNTYGDQIYTYLRITLPQIAALEHVLKASNRTFNVSDYGEVIASGKGDPSPEVVRSVRKMFPVVHEGAQFANSPDAAESAAPPALPSPPNFSEALASVNAARSNYAAIPDDKTRATLASALGNAAFAALFEKKFADAQQWSEEAIQLVGQLTASNSPKVRQRYVFIYGNYAHAFLFQGQYEKALAIYREYWNQKMNALQKFSDSTLEDFAMFEAVGLNHPDIARVKQALGVIEHQAAPK